ncbi:MAG: hypothetical protein JOZ54_02665 [Acidobacteria bacterium]|nr:hypothetical protein [Acidobacteriota bacterium]
MKRAAIAAAWLFGAIVPLFASTTLLVGCCLLPFHRVVHRAMPMCHQAAETLGGGATKEKAPPAAEKQESAKRVASRMPQTVRVAAIDARPMRPAPLSAVAYRSFLTHGAARCDQDVGLHLLDSVFLI